MYAINGLLIPGNIMYAINRLMVNYYVNRQIPHNNSTNVTQDLEGIMQLYFRNSTYYKSQMFGDITSRFLR